MSKYRGLINNEDEVISYLKDKVQTLPYVKKIYLVGSRARGEERQDSDWDFYLETSIPVVNINKIIGRRFGYNIDFSTGTNPPKKTNKLIINKYVE